MNLNGRVEQQILQGGVEICAHGKTRFRRRQHDIRRWPNSRQIENPGRQDKFMQERIGGYKRVRILVTTSFDVPGLEQRLDYWGLPAGHNERDIDLAGNQLLGRNFWRKSRQLADNTVEARP